MPISHLLTESFYLERSKELQGNEDKLSSGLRHVTFEDNADIRDGYVEGKGRMELGHHTWVPSPQQNHPDQEYHQHASHYCDFKGKIVRMEGELVMYVCQSSDSKVTKKVAWRGYAYTKRGGKGDVSYWYCDQRKICGASLLERNGTFTRKEEKPDGTGTGSSLRPSGKGGWDVEGNHETHPPNLARVESEISRRTRRLERKQKIIERRAAREAKRAQKESEEYEETPVPAPTFENSDSSERNVEQNIRIDEVWGHFGLNGSGPSVGVVKPSNGGKSENLVLIDTDGGCYDAWALFLALWASGQSTSKCPGKKIKIVGITTVNGCTTVDNAIQNVGRVLQASGKKIPVYKGMDSPIMSSSGSTQRPPFFGSDGFGDPADLPPMLQEQRTESDHAVNAIIKLAEKYKGKLTILALGPLTNLAMAVKLKPEIKNYVKEIFIMGGNSEGIGNMTVSSEFNFYVDPEAAEIVLQTFNASQIYVLPWETCIKFAASTYDFRINTLGTLNTHESNLLNQIESTILSKYHDQWIAPDAVAVACFLNRMLMRKTERYHCTVELQGSHTRGMMVVDKNFVQQNAANVTLITEVDLEGYENMLTIAMGGQNHHTPKRNDHDHLQSEQESTSYLKINQEYF